METAPAWYAESMPDLSEMTAVVTGASGGIGSEVARGLASKGAHVVLAVRSVERGEAAASAILATSPRASLEVMALDLADLASVRRFVEAAAARLDTRDLLVNNAGVASSSLQHTADGFELDFGTNHLGHFALTGLLLPTLIASRKARVITVTSLAHRKGRIDFDNLDGARGYSAGRAYAQSKLAGVVFAYELQRRLSDAGSAVLSVACHPGWASTNMTLGSPQEHARLRDRPLRLLARRLAPTAARGARPILHAATSPDVRGGDFIGPGGRFEVWGNPTRVRSSDPTCDEDVARTLWQVSEHMTGVRYALTVSP
jgi:NAD(P)-dependent dehydrogenase (short-subunit alcohol dehydrogenase family)